jgi:sulfur-oxidizing protein SoxY
MNARTTNNALALSRRWFLSGTLALFLVRTQPSKGASKGVLSSIGFGGWGKEEGRDINAFNARSPDSALGSLGMTRGTATDAIAIEVADVAENGANVPLEVSVNLPDVKRVIVIGEKNVFPLIADIRFGQYGSDIFPWFEIKIKLAETSNILVIAQAGGTMWSAARRVRVIVGGCLPG